MADAKVTALSALAAPTYNDLFYVIDVSDTSGGASGTSKKVQIKDVFQAAAHNGNDNGVCVGLRAGYTTVSNDAICIGYEAGYDTTAARNLAQMIAIGRHAGWGTSDGSNAVIVGHASAQYGKSSSNSVILGYEASRNPSNLATFNCFSAVVIGHLAGRQSYASQTAVLIGASAGANSTAGVCDGVASVCIGWSAASASLNHRESVFLGNQAGQSASSNYSVYVGSKAGQATAGSFNVFIGFEAGMSLSRANTLVIETNATHRAGGVNALIYGEFDNRLLRFGADTVRAQKDLILEADQTPASATATGIKGMVRWDADYVYVCTATNTWKRAAISTW